MSINNSTGIINIATGKSKSVSQIIKLIRKTISYKFKTKNKPRTTPLINQKFLIDKLNIVLNNFTFTPLDQAIKKTFDFYIKNQ